MSTAAPTKRYRLDPHARFRVLDDEGIFVLQESGEVLVVNEVAALVVEQLQAGRSVEEAVNAITERFDVGAEQARVDTAALLETLIEAGAITRA